MTTNIRKITHDGYEGTLYTSNDANYCLEHIYHIFLRQGSYMTLTFLTAIPTVLTKYSRVYDSMCMEWLNKCSSLPCASLY